MVRPGPTTRQHNSGQSQRPSESRLERVLFRYQRTMLCSACESQLPSAKAALVVMYLIFLTMALCAKTCRRGDGTVDSRAVCDSLHAGGISSTCRVTEGTETGKLSKRSL